MVQPAFWEMDWKHRIPRRNFSPNIFLVIGYSYNCENEPESFLVELISKYKKKRYCIDIFLDEEKITYHEGYKITHRFGGGCDYSIIPDPHLSHLCDRLVIISNLTFTEPSPNCNIF